MKHTPANRLLVTSFILLALSLAGWGGFLYYLSQQAAATAVLGGELVKLEASGDQLASLKKVVAQSQAVRPKIDAYFVDQDSAVVFIENIEKLAALSSTTLQVAHAELGEENGRPALKLALQTTGTFSHLFHLIELIENAPFLVRFDQLELEKNSTGDKSTAQSAWSGNFNVTLLSFIVTNGNKK